MEKTRAPALRLDEQIAHHALVFILQVVAVIEKKDLGGL